MAPGAEESVGVLPSYDQSLFQFRSKWEGPWYSRPLRTKGPSVNVLCLLGHLGDLCSAVPDFSQVTQVIPLSLSEDAAHGQQEWLQLTIKPSQAAVK